MDKQQMIEKYFNTKHTVVDFFYAYCENKGIDNPEEDLTDEEYTILEKECEARLTPVLLSNMRREIEADIDKRIHCAMKD